MTQGTQKKTPLELEEAIEQLGATITVNAATENIRIRVNTLAKNYDATLALVEEILLEPRWDAKEFDLIKQSTISQIRQQQANPNAIAQNQLQPADLRKRKHPLSKYFGHNRFGQRDHT